jgi:Fe2+ or Zn2+ uptake regulation protein
VQESGISRIGVLPLSRPRQQEPLRGHHQEWQPLPEQRKAGKQVLSRSRSSVNAGSKRAEEQIEIACARLRAAGKRITKKRLLLLAVLFRRPGFRSLVAIHADLKDSHDFVSVYRNLRDLTELGLAQKCFSRHGGELFRIALSGEVLPVMITGEHQKIEEVEIPPRMNRAIQLVEDHLRRQGYARVSHVIEFLVGRNSAATDRGHGLKGKGC